MRYLDPKNDLTFKRVFGEHPRLLMSFLNAMLPLEPGGEVIGIEYLSPELVRESAFNEEELAAYEKYRDGVSVERTIRVDAHAEGHAEGRAEGEQIGMARSEQIGMARGEETAKKSRVRRHAARGNPGRKGRQNHRPARRNREKSGLIHAWIPA